MDGQEIRTWRQDHEDLRSEVSAITANVANLTIAVGTLAKKVDSVVDARQWNWQTVAGVVLMVAGIWAALINPMTQNIQEQKEIVKTQSQDQKDIARTQADAVLKQNETYAATKQDVVRLQIEAQQYKDFSHTQADAVLKQNEVAASQRQDIVKLQMESQYYKQLISDMNKNGTLESDKRLAIAEWRLDHLQPVAPPPKPHAARTEP